MKPATPASQVAPRSSVALPPDGRQLPPGVRLARRTPTFTASTMPAGLRSAHRSPVWAELVVEAGRVEFREQDPPGPWATSAGAGQRVVIVPGRPHAVSASPDAEFHIRFYEAPSGDELGDTRLREPRQESS